MKPLAPETVYKLDDLCEEIAAGIDAGLFEEEGFQLQDYFWIDRLETFLADARRLITLCDLITKHTRHTEKKG